MRNNPEHQNYATSSNFRFDIAKIPNTIYYLQSANIPTVTLGQTVMPNPMVNMNIAGDQINFSSLSCVFIIDEHFKNYSEILNWMTQIRDPEFIKGDLKEFYSDATLHVLTNNKNYDFSITFYDCYPTNIGDVSFGVTSEGEPLSVDVEFEYSHFKFDDVRKFTKNPI